MNKQALVFLAVILPAPALANQNTLRDHLRAVECPMDMIDQIGGWISVGGVGASYGEGYPANILAKQMAKACINI